MTDWPKAIAVRLDQETLRKVEGFAAENGLLNDKGEPNMSAALRILISAALGEGREGMAAQIWQSARGSAMRELATKVFAALKDYRDGE